MRSLFTKVKIASLSRGRALPDTPGVYFFLEKSRKILYIGRASSLRSRVRSYFRGDILEARGPWIQKMLGEVKGIDYRKTDSVLEAILLEADLIKKFKPPYNTDLKDDKSFNCVAITKEDFPRVMLVRKHDIESPLYAKRYTLNALYGPFPVGLQLKTALKIIRKIFPFRDSCAPYADVLKNNRIKKPCFNRQIGLCPGVCTGEISKADYAKTVRNIRLFFEGKKARLLKLLEKEMKAVAKVQKFERAGELKRQIFALKHIQDVALLKRDILIPPFIKEVSPAFDFQQSKAGDGGFKSLGLSATPFRKGRTRGRGFRIEAYDLSHFGGKEIVGAMAVVEDGVARPSEYRLFKLRGIQSAHEVAGLQEILRRRFNHPEWPFPQLIAVDGNEVQKQAAEKVLGEVGQSIPVVAVVKDERHRPRDILGLDEERQGRTLGREKGPTLVGSYPRLSASSLHMSALLANSEAHRFVLKFQRRRRLSSAAYNGLHE